MEVQIDEARREPEPRDVDGVRLDSWGRSALAVGRDLTVIYEQPTPLKVGLMPRLKEIFNSLRGK